MFTWTLLGLFFFGGGGGGEGGKFPKSRENTLNSFI